MEKYKNPNLIHVGSKSYREQDLLDMIEYYHQNYKPNIILPHAWNEDASSQIFKHYPFYPQISKSTFRPELYYNQYCHLDISFKEFLNYIVEQEPHEFALLRIYKDWDVEIYVTVAHILKNKSNGYTYIDYSIGSYDFMQNGVIISDYSLDTDDLIQYLIDQYEYGSTTNQTLWYDFNTAFKIYQRRAQCQQFNPNYNIIMGNAYIKKLASSILPIVDINTFILYFINYLFILHNLMIIKQDSKYQENIQDFVNLTIDLPETIIKLKNLIEPYSINNLIFEDVDTGDMSFYDLY
jgi:hypothetical protein